MTIEDQLRREEGVKPKLYQDTKGKWTIGVGRNLSDGCLSDDEITYLLDNDIKKAMAELDRVLPWWRNLDAVRQKVLIDMEFNMGTPTLLEFHNTLSFIQAGDYNSAANGMLSSLWAKQVGLRADNLAVMMRTGVDMT